MFFESFVEDDDLENFECPGCGKKRGYMSKNMVIMHTTCCGWKLCATCANREKSRKVANCSNDACKAKVTHSTWTDKGYSRQKYDNEIDCRKDLQTVFNQERVDFDNDDAFYDYQEFVQDILYDLVYGTESEKESARQRKRKYEVENKEKISKVVKRKYKEAEERKTAEELQQTMQLNKDGEHGSYAATRTTYGVHGGGFSMMHGDSVGGIPGSGSYRMPGMPGMALLNNSGRLFSETPAYRQALLQLGWTTAKTAAVEEEFSIAVVSLTKTLRDLPTLARVDLPSFARGCIGGGFNLDDYKTRCSEEAREGLLF